ncbi:BMC domain-containing protein [uncultured Paludibaculum sp.]|uniref:BMC domain-containing protein n=1 Tax=uncultured Paludibaculum sp. TaxID=1765020 RepID=UPI002AAAD025|nr:BMC domain-containing protein [uncultured Paludibaculum sp.]
MVILDAMEKTGSVRVLQAELNDQPGVCLKVVGPLGDVQSAAAAARQMAESMHVASVVDVISAPHGDAPLAYQAQPDFNPLFSQATVQVPVTGNEKEKVVDQQAGFAVGLIETQGFTAVFEAIDTALKTASVEVLAREKLGGGYITVIIKGDVAAVSAAVEAGKKRVEGLGKLIAAHVIPSPSQGVISLLPKL